jgi:hypothetical protein
MKITLDTKINRFIFAVDFITIKLKKNDSLQTKKL